MIKAQFSGLLQVLINRARSGTAADVDFIMEHLTMESSLAMTRYIDYSLGLVSRQEGFNRIVHYLFNGTRIQRNYATLYLNRAGEWPLVKFAYEQGLIDEIQAYSR